MRSLVLVPDVGQPPRRRIWKPLPVRAEAARGSQERNGLLEPRTPTSSKPMTSLEKANFAAIQSKIPFLIQAILKILGNFFALKIDD